MNPFFSSCSATPPAQFPWVEERLVPASRRFRSWAAVEARGKDVPPPSPNKTLEIPGVASRTIFPTNADLSAFNSSSGSAPASGSPAACLPSPMVDSASGLPGPSHVDVSTPATAFCLPLPHPVHLRRACPPQWSPSPTHFYSIRAIIEGSTALTHGSYTLVRLSVSVVADPHALPLLQELHYSAVHFSAQLTGRQFRAFPTSYTAVFRSIVWKLDLASVGGVRRAGGSPCELGPRLAAYGVMMDVYMQAGLVDEALKLCHPFAKQYEGQNEAYKHRISSPSSPPRSHPPRAPKLQPCGPSVWGDIYFNADRKFMFMTADSTETLFSVKPELGVNTPDLEYPRDVKEDVGAGLLRAVLSTVADPPKDALPAGITITDVEAVCYLSESSQADAQFEKNLVLVSLVGLLVPLLAPLELRLHKMSALLPPLEHPLHHTCGPPPAAGGAAPR
ncbi:hypothetical protein B0H14DRAFT_3533115 [Mycena olivaceomarginata]|nr:hypothetical protein B0H14DRAFT_3533115 [Mycena olivaceomarginata]